MPACELDARAIDTIHVGNAFAELQRKQAHLGAMVAQVVPELWGVPAMRHEGACASSSLAALAAMAEIEAGRYDCALVLGVEELKNLPGDVSSQNQNAAAWQGHEGIACRFMWPAVFGRLAGEYERRYGLDRRHLNRIAELNYASAKRNPNAQTRRWQFNELSFTDDDNANPVIEPGVRRQDCGQITDGAAAVILASARFADDHARRRGASLDAVPQILGWGHHNGGLRFLDKIERSRDEQFVFPHVRTTITDAWRRAGIAGVDDLDGIETHDCFTSTEYMAIDHFGITPPGESWRAVEEARNRNGRPHPDKPVGRPHRRRSSGRRDRNTHASRRRPAGDRNRGRLSGRGREDVRDAEHRRLVRDGRELRRRGARLEHDPEKWNTGFRKRSCSNERR